MAFSQFVVARCALWLELFKVNSRASDPNSIGAGGVARHDLCQEVRNTFGRRYVQQQKPVTSHLVLVGNGVAKLVRRHAQILVRLDVLEANRLASHKVGLNLPKVAIIFALVSGHLLVVGKRAAMQMRVQPVSGRHVAKNDHVAANDCPSVRVSALKQGRREDTHVSSLCMTALAICETYLGGGVKRLHQPIVIVVFALAESGDALLARAAAIVDLVRVQVGSVVLRLELDHRSETERR